MTRFTENELENRQMAKKLLESAWSIVKFNKNLNIEAFEFQAVEGYQFSDTIADYALFIKGNLVASVEFKKSIDNAVETLKGMKNSYKNEGNNLEDHSEIQAPFLYLCDGERIYFYDSRNPQNTPRRISDFHTPSELSHILSYRYEQFYEWRTSNQTGLSNLELYQKEIVKSIELSIYENKRNILISMASGIGKTSVMLAQIYRLIRARFASRILVLANSKERASEIYYNCKNIVYEDKISFSQLYQVFSEDTPHGYLNPSSVGDTYVYISSLQNLCAFWDDYVNRPERIESELSNHSNSKMFPITLFNIIIIDETFSIHISKNSELYEIIEYFDSIKICFSNSPSKEIINYFGEVLYKYTIQDAINDGYTNIIENRLKSKLEKNRNDEKSLIELISLYYLLHKFDNAELLLHDLREILPEAFQPVLMLSNIYSKQGDLNKAAEILDEYLAIDDRNDEIKSRLADIYLDLDRLDYAEALITEIQNNETGIYEYSKLASNENEESSSVKVSEGKLLLDEEIEKIKVFTYNGQFEEGYQSLLKIGNIKNERVKQLMDELSFLYDIELTLSNNQNIWKANKEQIEFKRKLWMLLSENSSYSFDELLKENYEEINKNITSDNSLSIKKETNIQSENTIETSSQEKGEKLEIAMVELLKEFFNICEENIGDLLVKLRRQNAGHQYGFDIEFNFIDKNGHKHKCLMECKNYSCPVPYEEVANKLLEVETNNSNIKHWILISPKTNPENKLDRYIEKWEEDRKFSFNIHVWSPQNSVKTLFGINPRIYDEFGFTPTENERHPKEWTEEERKYYINVWRNELATITGLPLSWRKYIRKPYYLLLRKEREKAEEYNVLFRNYIQLKCADKDGNLIEGTAEEYLSKWLDKKEERVIILLGEFGDGKTFFTYTFSRKLIEEFKLNPESGWIPLRFSLQDLTNRIDGREFVRRRLEEFSPNINDWYDIKEEFKILVILDGFDEMSKKLDNKTIKDNISRLVKCYNSEFRDIKVLITSRKHFFEDKRNRATLLERLKDPEIIHLLPIDRKLVEEHLLINTESIEEREKLFRLKGLHDPIGLAKKPLYLQMVKECLKELPEGDLDAVTIYDINIKKSLRYKIEQQLEEELNTSEENIISNMIGILEKIALKLHQSEKEYISLSDFKEDLQCGKWAEVLWKIVEPCDYDEQDAKAHVAVRSILKYVENDNVEWPVDFCHRSMREYFVARGICKLLIENIKMAEEFLMSCLLNFEIIMFTCLLFRKHEEKIIIDNLFSLLNKTKNIQDQQNRDHYAQLGCNCVNLIYGYKKRLPGDDWSGLILDYANLSDADLSGKDFSYTSLKSASLDNANLENSCFAFSDLTGVRIEETKSASSIAIIEDSRFYSAYNTGTLIEWNTEKYYYNKVINTSRKDSNEGTKLVSLPCSEIAVIFGNDSIVYFSKKDNDLKPLSSFKIKSDIRLIKVNEFKAIVMYIKSTNLAELQLIDLNTAKIIKKMRVTPSTICENFGFEAFLLYDEKNGMRLQSFHENNNRSVLFKDVFDVTCITFFSKSIYDKNENLVALGQKDGTLQLWIINTSKGYNKVRHIVSCTIHKGSITDIKFLNDGSMLTSGVDGKVCLVNLCEDSSLQIVKEFKLKLNCKGMIIDGLKEEMEREKLALLIREQDISSN